MNSYPWKLMFGQFCIALSLVGLILAFLYITPEGRVSLTLPDDSIAGHPWNGSDTMTYVDPARSFVTKGVFERNGILDMHRTIGYPFFIAMLMSVFGEQWPMALLVVQAFLSAAIFPAIVLIHKIWFPESEHCSWPIFLALIVSGVVFSYVGLILTDMFFSTLFIVGFSLGLLAVVQRSWWIALLHIVLIAFAAQVRPTLIFYWIPELLLLIYTAKLWGTLFNRKTIWIIGVSVIVLGCAGNAPAFRNYINHGIFTPSDVFADNLATYLARPVKISIGEQDEYNIIADNFAKLDDKSAMVAQKEFAIKTIAENPVATATRVAYHVYWNLFEPHWEYIAVVYGKGFALNSMFDDKGNVKKGLWFSIPFFMFYLVMYFFALLAIIHKISKKEWFLLTGLVILMAPLIASFINGQGARMRLFAEPLIFCFAVCEMRILLSKLKTSARL